MRHIKQLFSVGLFALILCSCNKETTADQNVSNDPHITTEVIKTAVVLPSDKKQGETETLLVTFTIKVNEQTGELISKEVSENLLQRLHLKTQKDFQNLIAKEILKKEEASKTARRGEGETHSDCINGCNERYTDADGNKIKGRGACRANCWVDTIIEVIYGIGQAAGGMS